MLNKPFISLRRFSECALTILFLAGTLCAAAHAQATPTIASFATGVNHNTATKPISPGNIANIATDSFGDVLAVDDSNGALYEFPFGGGNAKVLVPTGGLAGGSGTIVTPGIAIDSDNNLYIEGGTCVLMYPYDSGTATWDLLAALSKTNTSAAVCGASAPTFTNFGTGVVALGLAIGNTSTPNVLAGTTSSTGNSIVSIPVTGAWTAPVAGAPTAIISGMKAPAISVAEDTTGNIYFVESGTGALPGVYKIPAGQTGLTSDSGLARIDPSLPNADGVAVDSQGNIYFSDNQEGVFLLPEGATSSSSTLLLTSVTAQGSVASYGNGFLFVPTQQTLWNGVSDVAIVTFDAANFGSEAIAPASPVQGQVVFSFNSSNSITPGTIEVLESGDANPNFAAGSGSKSPACVTMAQAPSTGSPLPYTALESCTVTVSFSPSATAGVSATLVMLDTKGNLIASIPLNGIGIGGAVQVMPPAQTAIGGGLISPQQIAVDSGGNVYVADSGQGAVVHVYPGATATFVGKNLKAPTGVAVDGAGDVFIADSGNVYEVPETASGLNAAGQVTLATGLGAQVALAADGLGDLYVSDEDNQKVYELENFSAGTNTGLPPILNSEDITLTGTAFSGAPSAIAVDSANNLYVANGGSVYEVTPTGTQTAVLSGLTGVTDLAVDPSGSIYITATGGTVRIPNVSGTLKTANETAVASGVTKPTSVAMDLLGNVYVTDGTALNVNVTEASASLNFGTLTADPTTKPAPPGSSSSQVVTLLNYGNAPLAVTGYTSTPDVFEPDYSETSDTCSGNSIAVNSTCTATITFSPGIGDGGALTGEVLVQGNVGNSPVGVNGTGVAPTLSNTATAMVASSKGTIEGVPVMVTVTPTVAGNPTPTGTVTLSIVPGSNVPLTDPTNFQYEMNAQDQVVYPLQVTEPYSVTMSLVGTTGAAQFDPTFFPIGAYTFTARYNGDPTYIYEHSSNAAGVSIATAVPVTLTQPAVASITATQPLYTLPCTSGSGATCTTAYNYGQPSNNPPGYLVLAGGNGAQQPYDGSINSWGYIYPLTVASDSGDPMIGTAVYSNGAQTGWNYGAVNYVTTNGQSACGNGAGSKSIVNLDDTGSAPLDVSCFAINTNNNTIPDIMTYYSVTPEYSGTYNDLVSVNPNYENSSNGQAVGFWALSHSMVQIGASPASVNVAAGSAASTTLTISSILGYGYAGRTSNGGPDNNYSLPLSLTCQGLPAYATCSFSYPAPNPADPQVAGAATQSPYPPIPPNLVALECAPGSSQQYCAVDVGPVAGAVNGYGLFHSGNQSTPCTAVDGCLGPGTVVMTINTNVSVGTSTSKLAKDKEGVAFAALFGLGLLGLTFRRRVSRMKGLLVVLCVLLFGGAFATLTACSTTQLGTESTAAVTPAGSYWVTVTAKQAGSILITTTNGGIVVVQGNGDQMSLPYTVNVTVSQ